MKTPGAQLQALESHGGKQWHREGCKEPWGRASAEVRLRQQTTSSSSTWGIVIQRGRGRWQVALAMGATSLSNTVARLRACHGQETDEQAMGGGWGGGGGGEYAVQQRARREGGMGHEEGSTAAERAQREKGWALQLGRGRCELESGGCSVRKRKGRALQAKGAKLLGAETAEGRIIKK
ncbi:unnamed protein product [Calypogeia fissa]